MMLMGIRVLVVEDEPLLAMMVEEYLEEIGCIVAGTASRLEDALEKAHTLLIDVAVLDVNLAGQLSYPVAEELGSRHIPFVFATGYGTIGLPDGLRYARVLSKPFHLEQLGDALRVAMVG
jgi:CheY-like chemotaxis protein